MAFRSAITTISLFLQKDSDCALNRKVLRIWRVPGPRLNSSAPKPNTILKRSGCASKQKRRFAVQFLKGFLAKNRTFRMDGKKLMKTAGVSDSKNGKHFLNWAGGHSRLQTSFWNSILLLVDEKPFWGLRHTSKIKLVTKRTRGATDFAATSFISHGFVMQWRNFGIFGDNGCLNRLMRRKWLLPTRPRNRFYYGQRTVRSRRTWQSFPTLNLHPVHRRKLSTFIDRQIYAGSFFSHFCVQHHQYNAWKKIK